MCVFICVCDPLQCGPQVRQLGVLHLLADLVAEDLVPVDLGACDWQLAA